MDMLVHADGTSLNDTKDHRWGVSVNPPGKDFYNWTARCVSAGAPLDPFQVSKEKVTGGERKREGENLIFQC